jgi:hypothetical protein
MIPMPLTPGTELQLHKSNCIGGVYCYKPKFTPLFSLPIAANPTPITTQLVLPITPNLPKENIAKALGQLYVNLTHFLTSHHCIPYPNLLSHQPDGA